MTPVNTPEEKKKNPYLFALGIMISGALLMGAVGNMEGSFLKSSVLSIFNKIGLVDIVEEYPDLGIEKVTLVKVADPVSSFPYYKYKATVLLANYGETLDKANVVISSGENQKTAFVRNELYGLSLKKDEKYMFDDYEVLMDESMNFRNFEFVLDIKDAKDRDAENNSYVVEVLEDPAEIQAFGLDAYMASGWHELSYLPSQDLAEDMEDMTVEICVAQDYEGFETDELRYAELEASDSIYSYYKATLAPAHLISEDFECEVYQDSYRFSVDEEYAVYLRASEGGADSDMGMGGAYAMSNLIYLPVDELLNRADYSKYFVEFSDMEVGVDGDDIFRDVTSEEWYAPYVQVMFDYGLVHDNYRFEFKGYEAVTRAEILEPILNYFDVDLTVKDGAPHFHDVQDDSGHYYFAESLYASGKGRGLGIYLYPEKQASKQYLKYLIDEFATQ